MSGIGITTKFESIKPGDDVEIIISCPLSGDILYKYYCSRYFLESKSLTFQEWFKQIDFYQDYIEIGDKGCSGVSDLMLFYKNESNNGFYSLYINCSMYANMLGIINGSTAIGMTSLNSNESDRINKIPIILRVLEYMDNSYYSYDYHFQECLKFLKLI